MSQRKKIEDLEPEALKAMLGLEHYGKSTGIKPLHKELIKMRASMINGCAYCLDMHTEDALKLGESPRRIFALSVWQESHLFSEEERALLQLVEEVTKISVHGVTDETFDNAVKFFGDQGTAQIIMLTVIINSWNRMAISCRKIFKP